MKTNYINKKNPVQKAKIYEDSTHLYKFYSFKFIEFKPNSLNLRDRKVWKLYRDDTTTTTTVYINRQKGILT
jgi:hypothetical protein